MTGSDTSGRRMLGRFLYVSFVGWALTLFCHATSLTESWAQNTYIDEAEGAGNADVHDILQAQWRRVEAGCDSTEVALAERRRELTSFSGVEESTILFLHVFKVSHLASIVKLLLFRIRLQYCLLSSGS